MNIIVCFKVYILIKRYECVYRVRDNFGRSVDGCYWIIGRGSLIVGKVYGGVFIFVDFFVFINGIVVIVFI